MITTDVARFLTIYLLILFGFSTSFFALSPQPEYSDWGLHELKLMGARIFEMFMCMLGDIDFEGHAASLAPNFAIWGCILLLVHVLIVTILLLNMLIAMMGDTFHDVKERASFEWHMAYAQIIMSVESEVGHDFWKDESQYEPYWTIVDGNRYLQVQEVNPKWFEDQEKAVALMDKFQAFDVNKDGIVSTEEFETGMRRLRSEGKLLVTDVAPQPATEPIQLGPREALQNRVDIRPE